MADIELVINIPEEIYRRYKKVWQKRKGSIPESCIAFGTPLPKGHGRLKDIDAIKSIEAPIAPLTPEGSVHYEWIYLKSQIDQALTIIEADKVESGMMNESAINY